MGWGEFLQGSGGWIILGGLTLTTGISLLLHHFIRERGSDDRERADPRDYPGEWCLSCKGEGRVDTPDASLSWQCPRCDGTGWDPAS